MSKNNGGKKATIYLDKSKSSISMTKADLGKYSTLREVAEAVGK